MNHRHPGLKIYMNWRHTLRWIVRLMKCALVRHATADQIFTVMDGSEYHEGHLSLCGRCGWSRLK